MDTKGAIHPRMVERFGTSADQLTWDFTPRRGLTFHDGAGGVDGLGHGAGAAGEAGEVESVSCLFERNRYGLVADIFLRGE